MGVLGKMLKMRHMFRLYLTLVRSLFEHCAVIWRPTTSVLENKIESVQKRAFKWILKLNEEGLSYSNGDVYLKNCRELKLLPMKLRFDFIDITTLHKIIHDSLPMSMPPYLSFFSGMSRLRFCHLDKLSLVCSIIPNTCASQSSTSNAFANSFFYRTHLKWNKLPLEIREISGEDSFKFRLKAYFLKNMHEFDKDNNYD